MVGRGVPRLGGAVYGKVRLGEGSNGPEQNNARHGAVRHGPQRGRKIKMALANVMNGRPTEPQAGKVYSIIKAKIDAKEFGAVIPHTELESIIGVSRDKEASRYRTVLNAAFKRVARETGITMRAERSVGYSIPLGTEQMRMGTGAVRSGVRKMLRGAATVAAITDERLPNELERTKRDHLVASMNRMNELVKTDSKRLQLTLGKTEALATK